MNARLWTLDTRLWTVAAVLLFLASVAHAKGRKPEEDGYPDYNKLEFKRRPAAEVAPEAGAAAPTPPAGAKTVPPPPAANAPAGTPAITDETPLPPPKAVPIPDDFSEPPLPDVMKETLVPGTTTAQ